MFWHAMRRATLLLVVLSVVVAGCVGGTGLEPTAGSSVPTSTVPTVSSTTESSTSTSSVGSGLSAEFQAAVFPVDGPEYYAGRSGFQVTDARFQMDFLADCIEPLGYREIAKATRELTLVYSYVDEAWRFPDLGRLRDTGFVSPRKSTVEDLWVSSMGSPPKGPEGHDSATILLEAHPEWGVSPDLRDVVVRDMGGCIDQYLALEKPAVFGLISRMSGDWYTTLDRLDEDPSVAGLMDGVMECLRQVDPVFADAQDPQQWLATLDGRSATITNDVNTDVDAYNQMLTEWGRGYADCVEPVVQARVPLRQAARSELVDSQYAQLLEVQTQLTEAQAELADALGR